MKKKLFEKFKNVFRGLFCSYGSSKSNRDMGLFDVGFHGDHYLLTLCDLLIKNCSYFVETGTNIGSTLVYVAKTYPKIQCLSCDPDKGAFNEAFKNTRGFNNISLFNKTSQDFFVSIGEAKKRILENNTLFFLDAHGYGFQWPLKYEIAFITNNFKKGYILIDDFKVPGMDCFRYDVYKGQVCSYDFIKEAFNPQHNYRVYYPNYTDTTSIHHPLCGWGLFEFGFENGIDLPEVLRNKIKGPIYV